MSFPTAVFFWKYQYTIVFVLWNLIKLWKTMILVTVIYLYMLVFIILFKWITACAKDLFWHVKEKKGWGDLAHHNILSSITPGTILVFWWQELYTIIHILVFQEMTRLVRRYWCGINGAEYQILASELWLCLYHNYLTFPQNYVELSLIWWYGCGMGGSIIELIKMDDRHSYQSIWVSEVYINI